MKKLIIASILCNLLNIAQASPIPPIKCPDIPANHDLSKPIVDGEYTWIINTRDENDEDVRMSNQPAVIWGNDNTKYRYAVIFADGGLALPQCSYKISDVRFMYVHLQDNPRERYECMSSVRKESDFEKCKTNSFRVIVKSSGLPN